MNIDRHLETELPRILEELGAGRPPGYGARIIDRTSRIRQRPAWTFAAQWLPAGITRHRDTDLGRNVRLVAVVALLLALLALAAIGVGSRRPVLPPPFGPAHNGAIIYDDAGDIVLGDPRTGNTRAIVTGPAIDSQPQFSPDGSMISFVRAVNPGASAATDILVARADGADARVITAAPLAGTPDFMLWSPDSTSITLAITATHQMLSFDVAGPSSGSSIDPAGLTVEIPWAFAPPDGHQILFRGTSVDGRTIGLYVMNPDGSGLRALIGPYFSRSEASLGLDLLDATWSPDGTHVAFQKASPDGSSMDMWLMDADGSHQRMIGNRPGDTYNGWGSWSPDGTRIVFQHATGTRSVTGYDEYDNRVVRLADDSVVDTGPVLDADSDSTWSPDGTQILVLFSSGQKQMLLDANGGPSIGLPWAQAYAFWPGSVGGHWQRTP